MIRRPPRYTRVRSSAASDVYKRQGLYKSNIRKLCHILILIKWEKHCMRKHEGWIWMIYLLTI